MQSHQLVEMAAKLAVQAETLIYHNQRISDESLQSFWITSRCRLQSWLLDFKLLQTESMDLSKRLQIWQVIAERIEEVMHAEVLTRVWVAILHAMNETCGVRDCDCIGRGVLMGQLEARHRALQLLMVGREQGIAEANQLNDIRVKTERWTDLLIAYVQLHVDVSGFGFDEARVTSFTEDLSSEQRSAGGQFLQALTLATIRKAFTENPGQQRYSRLNRNVANSILQCISADVFNGIGRPYSSAEARILRMTSDSLGAIDTILGELDSKPAKSLFMNRWN